MKKYIFCGTIEKPNLRLISNPLTEICVNENEVCLHNFELCLNEEMYKGDNPGGYMLEIIENLIEDDALIIDDYIQTEFEINKYYRYFNLGGF